MKDFKLIDSTYTPEEAREVLLTLINDKIRFLDQKIFSIHIKNSGDTTHFKERKEELKTLKQELIKSMNMLEDCEVTLDCSVNIGIKELEDAK